MCQFIQFMFFIEIHPISENVEYCWGSWSAVCSSWWSANILMLLSKEGVEDNLVFRTSNSFDFTPDWYFWMPHFVLLGQLSEQVLILEDVRAWVERGGRVEEAWGKLSWQTGSCSLLSKGYLWVISQKIRGSFGSLPRREATLRWLVLLGVW